MKRLYFIFIIIGLFSACKSVSTDVVDNNTIQVDKSEYKAKMDSLSVYREKFYQSIQQTTKKDSIHTSIKDSVFVFQKGDTLIREYFHNEIVYRDSKEINLLIQSLVDSLSECHRQNSLLISQMDSINSSVHNEKVVVKKKSVPEWLWIIGAIFILGVGFKFYQWIRNK